MSRIKAISLDAADTLIHLPRGVGEPYAEVAGRHGIDRAPGDWQAAFIRAWKSAPPTEITPDGAPSPDDQRGWWAALVHAVVEDLGLGLDAGRETALFDDLYAHFAKAGVWAVFPEVPEVLEELKARGLALAVISNFDRRLYDTLRHEGLLPYFDAVYASSEHGADKPHPRMFQRFLEEFGLSDAPDQALHVGDHPKLDWVAGREVGMRVLELRRDAGHTLRDVLGLV